MKNSTPNGIHYLIEFFGCDAAQIDSVDFWKKVLPESVKGTSMEVLHEYFYKFEPQGVTGFLLLSSSHISVHTWPDKSYAACDIFTCASEEETKAAFEKLKTLVPCDHVNAEKINRGYQFLNLPISCSGKSMKLEIEEVLHEAQSDFQKIVVAKTKEYGRCLIIDGVLHSSEVDHDLYDKELLKSLRKTDKHILILGGGDGYVAQRAMQMYPKLKIDIIDLDVDVVRYAQKFLGQNIFTNENVNLSIGDAVHFLEHADKVYDGIICDLTDTPIGTAKEEDDFRKFFEKMIAFSEKRMAQSGWIGIRGGASCALDGFINGSAIIQSILEKKLSNNINRSDIFIPSYGETYAFLFAEKK